jgi:hypothetical protein
MKLAEGLTGRLQTLGLHRREKPVPSWVITHTEGMRWKRRVGSSTTDKRDAREISAKDLSIISGIASDKAERLGAAMSPAHSPLSQLFEMLFQAGRLTVEVPQGSAAIDPPRTIDVTPVSDREPLQRPKSLD